MMSIYKITLIILLSFSLIQCKTQKEQKKAETTKNEDHDHSSHSHGDENEHPYMASITEADTMKANGFSVLYFSYFKLRDALSLDNNNRAADYAGSMYRAVNTIDTTGFSKETKQAWQARKGLIMKSAINIANSADNLEIQRSQVSQLSLNLMELMKTSKQENLVYLLHCASSNNKKGGNWLSLENNIFNNPFQNINTKEPCGFLIETIE